MGERARRVERARAVVDTYVSARERRALADGPPSEAERKEGIVHLAADLVALAGELGLERPALERLVAWHAAVDVADDVGDSGRALTVARLSAVHGLPSADANAACDASIWR